MKTAFHILLLEDVASDAELIELELRKSDLIFTTQRVDTKEAFLHALNNWSPDLILADYELPRFTGMEAIILVQKQYPLIPVIVVTGSINEETAVTCMKAGATNYVLKDHLLRLGPAVKEALNTKRIKEEKAKAKQVLYAKEAHLQSIMNHMLDGVITIDEHGIITSFNPAAEKIFGYLSSEVLERNINLLMPKPDSTQHDAYITRYLQTGKRKIIGIGREVIGKRKDGTTFPMDLSISEMLSDTTRGFIGTVRDISAKKQAERWQATEHAVTRVIAEASTIHVALPKILKAICEALALKVGSIWIMDHNENVLKLKSIWQAPSAHVSKFIAHSQEITFTKDMGLPGHILATGEPHWIADVTQDPHFLRAAAAFYEDLHGAIGFPLHVTNRMIGVMEFFSHYIQKPDDQFMDMFASIGSQIGQFITRKHAEDESRQLGRQLCHAQKMEALGTLAGGIAHDFNNILTSMNGFTELALLKDAANQKENHYLQQVLQAGRRAKDLTQQILAFSCHNEHELEHKPMQVAPLVEEVIKLIRATLPTTIDIRQHISAKDETISGNSSELHQVLMNLCTNAAHAMQDQIGVLEINLEAINLSENFMSTHPDLPACPYLLLTVTDTGRGMTQEVQTRIFEPFFTTKKVGVGTGLGLSVVHGIIKAHQGVITVESHLNEGTTFKVYLPQINAKITKEVREESTPKGTEHILFVDDETTLTHLAGEMLGHLGYQVTLRTSSIEGLEVFRSVPERFDLIITDKTMPNMTGEQLAKAAIQIRPDIPIILCTGFSDGMTSEYAQTCGIRAFLMKPFSLQNLAQTIRQVLDAPTPDEQKDLEPATSRSS